ncbi:hypothetical protein [Streptomyces melanogenes]|uniref:ATP-binding protein n=1 Tax=Streptomyces melanogenes TaxID=67326 RepID=A0ABZ1XWS0_9ACTN|nr:hypothetical protein [Streptomyces melanogenes]
MTNTDTATGSLTELRALLNVDDEQWQTIVAWLIAALLPGITRPALFLTGEQCSGKSVTAKMLQHLVDPGAPLHPLPADEDAWIAVVDAARVVAFNDVDRLTDWQSDALCAAISGATVIKRPLFTEAAPEPPADRAFILAGTLHPEQIRPDLAERLVVVELPLLTERRPQPDLWQTYEEARPRILAALLDLLSAVLGKLTPAAREKAARGDIPAGRMADWSLVVTALEETTA